MPDFSTLDTRDFMLFVIILAVAILALLLTKRLLKVSFPYFFSGLLALILGLLLGSLISSPLYKLPEPYGRWLPLVVNVFVVVAVIDLFFAQIRPISAILRRLFYKEFMVGESFSDELILDTSSLIDGRVEEIAKTGFLPSNLILPNFVLKELQKVADSEDAIKRARGRRGLEVLANLQKNPKISIEIVDEPGSPRQDVDAKLVSLAQKRGAKILTCDYNLNQVAQISKIEVLNVNQLSESIKPVLIPGEITSVRVVQKGKEKGQGVGYLPDGTMMVVEGGDKFVGEQIECEVERIFQTVAGKMVFVKPRLPGQKTHRNA